MRDTKPCLYPFLRAVAVTMLSALLCSAALADVTAPTTVTPADPAWDALRAVYAYDNTLPPDAVVVEQTQSGTMVTSRLTLAAHDGERIPATMHLPLGDGPFPCVLLLHGYGGNADDYSTVAAALLVPRGIAVMAIDARLHGRRAQEGVEMWSADLERSRQATINTVIDNRRALDYLDTLDCIDHSRYMALGLSMGAIMGAVLGPVDERIGSAALIVGGGNFSGLLANSDLPQVRRIREAGITDEMLADFAEGLEPTQFIGHFGRPLLLINGRDDEIVPPANAEALHVAASEPKTIVWYDGGHVPAPAMLFGPLMQFVGANLLN